MFIHNFKYALLGLLKSKENLFWTLLFPIVLATFMYAAFGNLFESNEMFHPIQVAVVEESENEDFMQVMKALTKEGENQICKQVVVQDEEQARQLLQKGKIKGIFYVGEEVSLNVKENGLDETILSSILKQYEQAKAVLEDTYENYPQQMQKVADRVMENRTYYQEKTTSEGNQSQYTNYFYAIFAMCCLFASFSSVERICQIQANTSSLGMRRSLSPNSKMLTVFSDFVASILVQYAFLLLAFGYMKQVLGIDFGNKYAAIFLLLFVGTCFGISMGTIIGAIPGLKLDAKIGIATSIGMFLSVLSDLVIAGIRGVIEHHVPIVNRLNPAALIVDSFYALNVYDDYQRFNQNLLTLAVLTVVLFVTSILMIRRNRYASL